MLTGNQNRVINPVLSRILLGYRNSDLVGDALFPRVNTPVAAGKIIEFGRESFILYNTTRSPGAATKRISFGHQGNDYALENHSLEAVVPREYLRDANIVPNIDLAARASKIVMNSMLLAVEYAQAVLATTAGNYGSSNKVALSGVAKWSDDACNPKTSINAAREAVRSAIGMYPNVLFLSAQAFSALRENPYVVERFKYVSKDSITAEMLAALFDFEKCVVGKAVTAVETSSGVTMSDVWGNNAVVAYVPSNPMGMEQPSFGYTYVLDGHPLVEQPYWDNNSKSWIYGVSFERKPVLTGITSGYLIQTPA